MSISFNIQSNQPSLSASVLQSGKKSSAQAGYTTHVYGGDNLNNLTGVFLIGSTPEVSNLLDIPSGQFGTNQSQNVTFNVNAVTFNTPRLKSDIYSLKVSDQFGKSSQISDALKILDNSIIAIETFESEESELIGNDANYFSATDINNTFGGVEIKSFDLTSAKTGICISLFDKMGEYADNIGSSTFRLTWTGDASIDYGEMTTYDVTTEGGTEYCWSGDFTPLPIGTYGRYSISFVSGNFSPDAGTNFRIGLFYMKKRA
jgi:hypothetical protein